MGLTPTQQQNLDFFKSKLTELLANKLMAGKFAVIADKQIQHTADTFPAAMGYAINHFKPTDFVIQQIIDESAKISYLYNAV